MTLVFHFEQPNTNAPESTAYDLTNEGEVAINSHDLTEGDFLHCPLNENKEVTFEITNRLGPEDKSMLLVQSKELVGDIHFNTGTGEVFAWFYKQTPQSEEKQRKVDREY